MIESIETIETTQTHLLDEIGDRRDIDDDNKKYHAALKAHFVPVFDAIARIKVAVSAAQDIGTRLSECRLSDILCCSRLLTSFSLFSQNDSIPNTEAQQQEIEMVLLTRNQRNGL